MKEVRMVYEETSRICADMFTKAFSNAAAWRHACALIPIVDPIALPVFVRSPDLAHQPPERSSPERRGVPNSDADDSGAALSTFSRRKFYGMDHSFIPISVNQPFINRIRDLAVGVNVEKGKTVVFGLCIRHDLATLSEETFLTSKDDHGFEHLVK